MLVEILIAILLGVTAGTLTGLTPGIHINLIGVLLVSLSLTSFSQMDPTILILFIVAMSITHTFIDFIPSIFLGCPDTDTELSILPGHELLKKGQGYQAVMLTNYGSLFSIILISLIAIPSIFILPSIYNLTKPLIPYLLILVSFFLIYLEKKKFTSFFVFLITGILGLCVLNNEFLKEPLLPLLTGLFGSSMLIISIKNKKQIPKQEIINPKTKYFRPMFGALIASPFCCFLPGLGSSQAAIIGNLIAKTKDKDFLVLLGATNTLVMGFSFISLYAISKTRTGSAVAIQQIMDSFTPELLGLVILTILISGFIAFFLTIYLTKIISQKITNINYTKISIATLLILFVVIFFISGFLGLIVFVISTFTGIYCIKLNVRRTNMMGCLIIPTILYYFL
ncbi:MAG TPA: tripartite tricarboxylate transporter permease [Candidatus Nanoarchaeia archaeon]|nr:tripartite tricarboxylate transporter permease [Candidatus Nanoarchaeia archaeon]